MDTVSAAARQPLIERLEDRLWTNRGTGLAGRAGLSAARYAFALGRDLAEGQMSLRAMSLVYTSLLSLVPLLALAFSILKALGAQNTLQPMLANFLAPLGAQGDALAGNIAGFVDKMQVGVLGSIGVAMLLYTTVSTIQKVESSFNFLWDVPQMRSLAESFGKYISMILIGPVVLFAALGLTATVFNSSLITQLKSIEPFGMAIVVAAALVPYALMIVTFTMLYALIPNTRVSWRAAAIGGTVGGIAWQAGSAVFAKFVKGATDYNAIYSSFAIGFFLLWWLYLSWLIVLTGCRLAFYVEHPGRMRRLAAPALPGACESEWAVLAIVDAVGQRFVAGQPPLNVDALTRALGIPPDRVQQAVKSLLGAGLFKLAGPECSLLPAKDLEAMSLHDLWIAARGERPVWTEGQDSEAKIAAYLGGIERVEAASDSDQPVREWVQTPT